MVHVTVHLKVRQHTRELDPNTGISRVAKALRCRALTAYLGSGSAHQVPPSGAFSVPSVSTSACLLTSVPSGGKTTKAARPGLPLIKKQVRWVCVSCLCVQASHHKDEIKVNT